MAGTTRWPAPPRPGGVSPPGAFAEPAAAPLGSLMKTHAVPAGGVPPGIGPLTQFGDGVAIVAPGKWTAAALCTSLVAGRGEVARAALWAPSRAASPAAA